MSIPLHPQIENRLQVLAAYDLSAVSRRLERKRLLPEQLIDPAILEFKRLIALFVLGHNVKVPCEEVDEVWHNFILFTQEYMRFCERVAGRYLHHLPADSNLQPSKPYELFLPSYTRYFGSSLQSEIQQKFLAPFEESGGGCGGGS